MLYNIRKPLGKNIFFPFLISGSHLSSVAHNIHLVLCGHSSWNLAGDMSHVAKCWSDTFVSLYTLPLDFQDEAENNLSTSVSEYFYFSLQSSAVLLDTFFLFVFFFFLKSHFIVSLVPVWKRSRKSGPGESWQYLHYILDFMSMQLASFLRPSVMSIYGSLSYRHCLIEGRSLNSHAQLFLPVGLVMLSCWAGLCLFFIWNFQLWGQVLSSCHRTWASRVPGSVNDSVSPVWALLLIFLYCLCFKAWSLVLSELQLAFHQFQTHLLRWRITGWIFLQLFHLIGQITTPSIF